MNPLLNSLTGYIAYYFNMGGSNDHLVTLWTCWSLRPGPKKFKPISYYNILPYGGSNENHSHLIIFATYWPALAPVVHKLDTQPAFISNQIIYITIFMQVISTYYDFFAVKLAIGLAPVGPG